jgi:hypothetical protein
LPQFESYGSTLSCAPYFETGKPQVYGWPDGRSLAVQPMVGITKSVSTPASRLASKKRSAAERYAAVP